MLCDGVQRDAVMLPELPPRDTPLAKQAQKGVLLLIKLCGELRTESPQELQSIHQYLHLGVSRSRRHNLLHVRWAAWLRPESLNSLFKPSWPVTLNAVFKRGTNGERLPTTAVCSRPSEEGDGWTRPARCS